MIFMNQRKKCVYLLYLVHKLGNDIDLNTSQVRYVIKCYKFITIRPSLVVVTLKEFILHELIYFSNIFTITVYISMRGHLLNIHNSVNQL